MDEHIIEILSEGGVGVLPTDTLYGLVGRALDPDAVERIYDLKQRDKKKPLIVLVSSTEDLEQFGVVLSDTLTAQLATYWPGPYSIILPVIDDQFEYLTRGKDAIAFRVPDKPDLLELIREVGPLVAPSANPEGYPPSANIDDARRYFGTDVGFYEDGGVLEGKASTIMEFDGEEVHIVRE